MLSSRLTWRSARSRSYLFTAQHRSATAAGRHYTTSPPTCTRPGVVSHDWISRVREAQTVRYRDDAARQRRFKTDELIVEQTPWHPERVGRKGAVMVGVCVGVQEVPVQRQVRLAGGRWNPARRVWELRRDWALKLGLKDRLASAKASIHRNLCLHSNCSSWEEDHEKHRD